MSIVDTRETGLADPSEAPVEMEALRRKPATERVLDHILAELDAGRLGPGDRVNAARISADLGLSAAPVREALSVLAGRGVIDLLQDRGAVMRALTPRDVVQMWEAVGAVVALGVATGAQAIASGADPTPLIALYRQIIDNPLAVSPLEFLLRLNEWHFAVHEIGGNRFINEMLDRAGVAYWDRYLVQLIDVHGNIDGYLANYRRLHEAVMAGDGQGAAAIMQFHAQWSVRLIHEGAAKQPRRRRSGSKLPRG